MFKSLVFTSWVIHLRRKDYRMLSKTSIPYVPKQVCVMWVTTGCEDQDLVQSG